MVVAGKLKENLDNTAVVKNDFENGNHGDSSPETPFSQVQDRVIDSKTNYSFDTTDSLQFLGLCKDSGLWIRTNYRAGVIIGIVDTGILREHPSFHEKNIQPTPAKWKGAWDISFNEKLIGARDMTQTGDVDPTDNHGHGTHVASTVGGNFVSAVHLFGPESATASGVAPYAHLATYKVESQTKDTCACLDDTVLVAMLAAIGDGVDIINVSMSKDNLLEYYEDVIAIRSFVAMLKGVLVISSAGNKGPNEATVGNVAPWILTVGASTIGRRLEVLITLSNRIKIMGESISRTNNFPQMACPIVQFEGGQNPDALRGKIVLVDHHLSLLDDVDKIMAADAKAIIIVQEQHHGMIISDLGKTLPMSSAHITYSDGLVIKNGTVIGDENAPIVAAFSGRGPNPLDAQILKPDVIAPGVHIIAGWRSEPCIAPSRFHIVSGTSTAAPHVTGVAALLKHEHPNWSPAAIKSAIMTTADYLNCSGKPILDETLYEASVYAMGAGQVNPVKAVDPGLIYDIDTKEYISYLKGIGYSKFSTEKLGSGEVLPDVNSSTTELNYPSFSVLLGDNTHRCTRTVTNVGDPVSTYVVKIGEPKGVSVVVEPKELRFRAKIKGERTRSHLRGCPAWTWSLVKDIYRGIHTNTK